MCLACDISNIEEAAVNLLKRMNASYCINVHAYSLREADANKYHHLATALISFTEDQIPMIEEIRAAINGIMAKHGRTATAPQIVHRPISDTLDQAKRQAIADGFDPNAPVPPEESEGDNG